MYAHPYLRGALGLVAGCLVASCDDSSRAREPMSPDLAVSSDSGNGGSPSHVTLAGPFGNWYGNQFDGSHFLDMNVSVASSYSADSVLLYYSIYRCAPDTYECEALEEGAGTIPTGDLSVKHGRLVLTTNTALANPNFTVYAGTGGFISFTWTELSGSGSSRSSYQNRSRYQNFSIHSHGSYTSTGALGAGNVLGVTVELGEGYGYMGMQRDSYMAILRR
jgi:hypothetical protein